MKIHLKTPKHNNSEITKYLFVGSAVRSSDIAGLTNNGFNLIINMRQEKIIRNGKNNIKIIWVPTLDIPFLPLSQRRIKPAIIAGADAIKNKQKILVGCRIGRHRSVILATCILIELGFSKDQAIDMIKKARPIADFEPYNVRKTIDNYAKSKNLF